MKRALVLFFIFFTAYLASISVATEGELKIESIKPKECSLKSHEIEEIIKSFDLQGKKILYGKDKEFLASVLDKKKNFKVVSSYNNQDLARNLIKQALFEDISRITSWVNSGDSKNILYLRYKVSDAVGYGLHRGADDLVKMSNMLIILKKDSKNCTFNVVSSYPYKEGEGYGENPLSSSNAAAEEFNLPWRASSTKTTKLL